MSEMIDLIGSSIIAGVLLIIALTLNATVSETTLNHAQNLTMQEEATFVASLLDYDIQKIGFGDTTGIRILTATPKSLVYRANIDQIGGPDTVGIYFTRISSLTSILTSWGISFAGTVAGSPNDSVLVRFTTGLEPGVTVRGIPRVLSYKLHFFTFGYLDSVRTTLVNPSAFLNSIRYVKVDAQYKNQFLTTDTSFSTVDWEKVYRPKNL